MKKFIKWALLICIPLTVAYAVTPTWVGSLSDGYHFGTKADNRIAFYDKTPAIVQPVSTKSAYQAMQDLGLIAAGGVGDPIGLNHVKVTLSAAQIIAMYTTPVQLVAAQGAGKSIVIGKVAFRIVRTSTQFTGGGAAIIQYAATANGGGTQACDSTIASTVITGTAATSDTFRNGAVVSDAASTVTENVGVYISNASGVFAAGTGTATVDIWYYVF